MLIYRLVRLLADVVMPSPDEVKEGLKEALNKTADGVSTVGKGIKNAAKAGIKKTAHGAVYAEEKASSLGETIKDAASSVGNKVKEADISQKASDALKSISKAIPSSDGIKKGLSKAQKAVTPEKGGKFGNAASTVTSGMSGIKNNLKGARQALSDKFNRLKSNLADKMKEGVQTVTQSKAASKVSSAVDDMKDKGKEVKQQGEEKLASVADKVQQKASSAAHNVQQKASSKLSSEWKGRLKSAAKSLSKGATTISDGVGKAVDLTTKATAAPGKTVDWAQRKFNKAYDEAKAAKSSDASPSTPPPPAENKRNSMK